jgi:heme exporter protein C
MARQTLAILSMIMIPVALYCAFIYAPTEATMGQIQRIFYFHVPQAILSYTSAILLGLASLMYLIKGDLKWDRIAYCSAELGVLFTATTLITGMIWAHPVWNTWWEFDARLTLELMLGLLFVGYHMLRAYLPERESRARLSTVFGFLALLDVPINYLSTYLWEQHHPRLYGPGGGGADPAINIALLVSTITFGILYAYLLTQRIAVARIEEEVEYLEQVVQA